jgi:hypothetical protein
MPAPAPGQASAGRFAGGDLPGLPDGDCVPGLTGVVDLGGLQSILDAAREGDEAAGDPLGEDSASSALPDAVSRWPAAELAAVAAEDMAPGPGLGYWTARFAPGQMSDYALPGAAAACRRLASWAQATELALVAEVAARAAARDRSVPAEQGGLPGRVPDEAAAEIALALTMSQYGASCWTDLAITLAGRLAATGTALRAGTIDLTRARLIAEATSVLDDRAARLAEEKVLPGASAKTTAQLRAALRRAVISVDPDEAERRREQAERRAKVGLYGDEEGTATLSGQNLPGAHAAAAMARITALARAMKASGAVGGIDLLRAQVYIGLLLGTLPLIPPAEDAPPGDPRGGPGDGSPSDPDEPGDPRDGNPGDRGKPGAPEGLADSGDPGDPGDPSSPDESRGHDEPHSPAAPDGPGGLGHLDDPRDSDDPGCSGGPGSSEDSACPDGLHDPGAGHTGDPEVGDPGPADPDSAHLGDLGDPDCPDGPCGPSDPYHPSGPDDPGGQHQGRNPAWPELPVPGQAPAGLARSGTGALAGLPLGPASKGLLHLTVPWRTLAGLLAEPGQLTRFGSVTPHTARLLADAASRDAGSLWKVIVTNGSGQAIAVTRIRRPRAGASGSPPAASLRRV